jgi:hypothetical protein
VSIHKLSNHNSKLDIGDARPKPVSSSRNNIRATLLKAEQVDPRIMRPSTSAILGKAMKTA